jgi:uncharacterized protein YkwD
MLRHAIALGLCLGLSACGVIPVAVTFPDDTLPTRPWPESATCPTPARAKADAASLLALMNAARASAGLGALSLDAAVGGVAQAYACENAARQSIDHVGSDGSDLLERFRRGGLQPALAAENTGLGFADPATAFAWWMNSPHHRENILRPGITRVGIGLAEGTPRPAWVVDFMATR